jgi:inosose dehydratase
MSLRDAPIGCVPIVWNNADLYDLAPQTAADTVMDELARIGFAGTQFGRGFPEGDALKAALERRDLRLAELYSALGSNPSGLATDAENMAHRDMARLLAAGGEVLVVALDGGGERDEWSGRVADGAPRWPDDAFDALGTLLGKLADRAPEGVMVAFHPHTATWVEAPDEVERLAERLEGTGAGLCLDVGHHLVGGGDPVEAIERYGPLIRHVHIKDVNAEVLERLRERNIESFEAAIRERIFTEAGNGALDLAGVVAALDRIGFSGWMMVEQDSSWLPPSEASAIGNRVLRYAVRSLA